MLKRCRFVVLAVLLVVLAGCEQLLVPTGAAPLRYRDAIFDDVTVTPNQLYGSAVNQQGTTVQLRLDLYEPTGDTVEDRPLIVFVHGGSFRFGSRTSAELVDQANHFAKRGYVTASISYRLAQTGCSSGAPTAECVTAIIQAREDAQTAVRYLRDNADSIGIDTDRIAIAGSSAGAITATEVAFQTQEQPDAGVDAAVSLSGAHLLTTPNRGDAPVLLFHGTSDFIVPYQWAVNTKNAADAGGVRAVLNPWEGAGHVPYTTFRSEILDRTRNFLYVHLKLATAAR